MTAALGPVGVGPVVLTPLGEQDAAVCIDGVCEIPGAASGSEAQ